MSLPSEYLQLEWIASTGTQYIDTGIVYDSTNITGTVDFQLTDATNQGWFVGVSSLNGSVYGMEGGFISGAFWTANGVSYSQSSNLLARTIATIDCTGQTIQNKNIYLFSRNYVASYEMPAKVKIYTASFTKDNSLVREYMPALRLTDLKPGLYDVISGNFFTNAGTGEDFTYEISVYKGLLYSGPTKSIIEAKEGSTEYVDIKWIGSTGTQYINTGITPNLSYNIEVVGVKDPNASLFGSGACSYVLTGNGTSTGKVPNYFYVGQTLTSPAEAGQIVGTIDQSAKHTWTITNGQGYCDGVAAEPTRIGSTQPSVPLFLFARNNNGFNDGGTHRIYLAKIWDNNGNLVRNYTPKIQLSTGKPGLYDTINNKFYPNNGSNEFTYELENYKTYLNSNNIEHISYQTLINF